MENLVRLLKGKIDKAFPADLARLKIIYSFNANWSFRVTYTECFARQIDRKRRLMNVNVIKV